MGPSHRGASALGAGGASSGVIGRGLALGPSAAEFGFGAVEQLADVASVSPEEDGRHDSDDEDDFTG